jgi:dihydrofolate synthase/folylpolyglutamate synthase
MVVQTLADELPVAEEALVRGIAHAQWPARLQLLTHGPVVEAWQGGSVVLDGGHNGHAAAAIAAWIEAQHQPVIMICGMLRRKSAQDFFAALAGRLAGVVAIPVPGAEDCYSAEELASLALAQEIAPVQAAATLEQAVALAGGKNATLLIAGSLYLAGEVLKNHS